MPTVGFYLQTAVGGIPLSRAFWTRFAGLDNVIAIKVAPFNRYKTLDVAFGVAAAGAEERVTLYTGNDDHIVADLATPLAHPPRRPRDDCCASRVACSATGACGRSRPWRCWRRSTRRRAAVRSPRTLLALDAMVTDCNSVIFDVANDFAGCIPGCHEVLRRQGLLRTVHCLDPKELLSPGQAAGIDRLYAAYPELDRRCLRGGEPREVAGVGAPIEPGACPQILARFECGSEPTANQNLPDLPLAKDLGL